MAQLVLRVAASRLCSGVANLSWAYASWAGKRPCSQALKTLPAAYCNIRHWTLDIDNS